MRSVVLCGSRRFKPEIRAFCEDLRYLGAIVYEPILHEGEKSGFSGLSAEYKDLVARGLTYEHVHKIRLADVVYIYNKDGYAGVSTTFEMGVAVALGKPLYVFSDLDTELSRKAIAAGVISTPHQLLRVLK